MTLYHLNCVQSLTESATIEKSRDICIALLSKLHYAREKSRQSFNDTLMRTMTNFIMYLDVVKPRLFDCEDLLKELPRDLIFAFAF